MKQAALLSLKVMSDLHYCLTCSCLKKKEKNSPIVAVAASLGWHHNFFKGPMQIHL